jgi:hypothetical protein
MWCRHVELQFPILFLLFFFFGGVCLLPAACCLLSMAMDVLGTVVGTCWEAKREPT